MYVVPSAGWAAWFARLYAFTRSAMLPKSLPPLTIVPAVATRLGIVASPVPSRTTVLGTMMVRIELSPANMPERFASPRVVSQAERSRVVSAAHPLNMSVKLVPFEVSNSPSPLIVWSLAQL